MEISPDQRATLQLLLVRGQRYSDLAALLSVDEAEVRTRARAALTEIGGADPDRNVALTDYLLGQADPIGRADASRHLRDHSEDHALATTLSERLRELFPGADLPRLPGEPRQSRFARRGGAEGTAASGSQAAKPSSAARSRMPSLDARQSRLIAILASLALLLIIVVLAIAGVFSGDDTEAPAETSATTTETDPTAGTAEEAVPIQMRPVQGSDAGGAVVFGLASADQPFIEFQIRNLEPPNNEDAYVLWFLSEGGERGFPLPTPIPVGQNGTVSERIPVPAEILSFAQQAQTITIALNNRIELDRDINAAVRQEQGALDYPGGTVLSARIP